MVYGYANLLFSLISPTATASTTASDSSIYDGWNAIYHLGFRAHASSSFRLCHCFHRTPLRRRYGLWFTTVQAVCSML